MHHVAALDFVGVQKNERRDQRIVVGTVFRAADTP